MIMLSNMYFVNAEDAVKSDITIETGKIYIPFEKKWSNVPAEEMPEKITIKLYKYLGDEFNESNAILIESVDLNNDNNWKYNFDISNVELFDKQNNAYKFKVVEEKIG